MYFCFVKVKETKTKIEKTELQTTKKLEKNEII